MSFNVALSGIAAAQSDLNTTANNIANVSTVGFKESRAEFNSVYANSLFSNNKTKSGDGVAISTVAQQFHQGSLKFTENPLDLAITGNGFFATLSSPDDRDFSFTRAGTFKLNSENFIVDNGGNYLQAFPVNEDGTSSSISLSTTEAVQIPETAGVPIPSDSIEIALNLPAGAKTMDPALFDPTDPETYNNATSITIYDSLGEAHVTSTYYIKPDDAAYTGNNHWVTFVTVDGKPVDTWDEAAGTAIAGTYGKDINSDGVQDTIANLNQSVTDLTAVTTAAATVAAASAGVATLSATTATTSEGTAVVAASAAAADQAALDADTSIPKTPALVAAAAASATASAAATTQANADRAQATADAAQASADATAEATALLAQNEVTLLLNNATVNGVNGSAQYTDANGNVHTGAVLTFNSLGGFAGSSPANLTLQALGVDDPSSPTVPGDGAGVLSAGADGTQRLTLNFKEPTQFSAGFEVTRLDQNGLTVGRLTGVDIGSDGLVKATYSNGTSQPLSRVAIVRFRNEQGLSQTGSNWIASENSGDPIAGEAASGSFGAINSAALEQSNVNLTTELVDLITAQRNFQANSRALEINNTLQQTILQIR